MNLFIPCDTWSVDPACCHPRSWWPIIIWDFYHLHCDLWTLASRYPPYFFFLYYKSPSLSSYTLIFLRKRMFFVTLLKTKIHLINLNKSSTSHFTQVLLHDFTDLHMKLAFCGGTKEHRWKWGGLEQGFPKVVFANPWWFVRELQGIHELVHLPLTN